jgi:hypothetical protein
VLTETLNPTAKVETISSTETKTTLVNVEDNRCTLNVETTVEVAGKRFPSEPKTVTQGLNGEVAGQTVTAKAAGEGEIMINGRRYATQTRQIVIQGEGTTRTNTIHFSGEVAPFVLKRETKATDATGESLYDSNVEVVAVNMPFKVINRIKPVSIVKTVRRQRDGSSTVAIEFFCAAVPGGVVSHSLKELDASGNVVRRKTLELIAYESYLPAKNLPATNLRSRRVIIKPRLIDRLRARKLH